MGQKISVNLFRAKKRMANVQSNGSDISSLQKSVWFASGRSYSQLLHQDIEIRRFLESQLTSAGLANIIIKRAVRRVEIILYVTKPGIVIGRGGSTINALKGKLIKKFNLKKDLNINIEEFKDPNRSANVVANEISFALKKNIPYRRLAKSYLEKIKYSGILGAKIIIKGRLNKADIARKEEFSFGSIPRHTIDASLDYSLVHCRTSAGILGVKVILYKGDKIKNYQF